MSAESDQVWRAIESVSMRLGKVEEEASRAPDIDLQGYGALTARVGHLEREVAGLRGDMVRVLEKLDAAGGGFKTLLVVASLMGTLGSLVGGTVAWVLSHLPRSIP